MSRSVVVVGAGISGLAAARGLVQSGHRSVTVLEASPRLGGKLAAVDLDGVSLDCGAESVLARRLEAVDLISELGLDAALVHPTGAKPQILIDGQLRPIPPSAMGVPNDLDQLAGLLSDAGLERARQEPALPAPALKGDLAIGAYVAERFGDEVTDRLLEPLLGGVYAGQSRDLSFAAVSAALYERARAGGSLLEHARQLATTTAHGPVFAGLAGGISTLVIALAEDLERRGVTVRTSVTVRELASLYGGGYRLVCGPTPSAEVIEADVVVLATPAAPTGRLLSGLMGPAAAEFERIPYASMAVMTLVVRGLAPVAMSGEPGISGVLVPPGQLPTIKALTYSSAKWQWIDDVATTTWGPDIDVVRASVGRIGEANLLQVDDDRLLQRTFAEASTVPGWGDAQLVNGHVQRWGGGLPQYRVGHKELVSRLQSEIQQLPGLALCGAAVNGVGIAPCIGSAVAAVSKINFERNQP